MKPAKKKASAIKSSSRDEGCLHHVDAWIFDLDNTLYPASSNLFDSIDRRMKAFISAELGIEPEEAWRIQKVYFKEYGTTLRGLMLNHGTDPKDFLGYVHDINLNLLAPDPALASALGRLTGSKLVYTNGDGDYAWKVLRRLGIEHHFDGVFDIVAANYVPKPEPESYRRLVDHFGIRPEAAAIFEDIPKNLAPAAALGMTTVWVRNDTRWAEQADTQDHIHHVTDDLVNWIEALLAARGIKG